MALRRIRAKVAGLFLLGCETLLITGCSTLPSGGPTASQVEGIARRDPAEFKVVQLTPAVLAAMANADAPPPPISQPPGPADKIGVDDVLQITVYETGLGLFSSGTPTGSSPNAIIPGNAVATPLTLVTVGIDGDVTVPYVGRLHAEGFSAEQFRLLIQDQLAKTRVASQPQVLVTVTSNLSNTVIVSGDVHTPGRYALTQAPEHLLDAVALAGSTNHSPFDTVVSLVRAGSEERMVLGEIDPARGQNAVLQAGDRIYVSYEPRSYTAFGATLKPSEVTFDTPTVTLAQAVARVEGLDATRANPRGVYLFRYERPAVIRQLDVSSKGGEAVIYQVNLMDPGSYFVMQRFAMRDRDVIYVAPAGTDQLHKFLELLSAAFVPLGTAGSISNLTH